MPKMPNNFNSVPFWNHYSSKQLLEMCPVQNKNEYKLMSTTLRYH